MTVKQGKSVKKEERISSRDRLSQFMTSMVEPEILSLFLKKAIVLSN